MINGQLTWPLLIVTYKYEFKEQILLKIIRAFHIDWSKKDESKTWRVTVKRQTNVA